MDVNVFKNRLLNITAIEVFSRLWSNTVLKLNRNLNMELLITFLQYSRILIAYSHLMQLFAHASANMTNLFPA